jgi:hypothetical protein
MSQRTFFEYFWKNWFDLERSSRWPDAGKRSLQRPLWRNLKFDSSPKGVRSVSYKDARTIPGFSSARVRINSPNRVMAQANHGRVNFSGLSFRNASWMKFVPAVVSRNHRKHWTISRSLLDVSACTMIDTGQTYDKPTCGLPMPSAAVPLIK